MSKKQISALDQRSPVKNPPIEVEAAKWFGPWTVLINRRVEGKLFHTQAVPPRA